MFGIGSSAFTHVEISGSSLNCGLPHDVHKTSDES